MRRRKAPRTIEQARGKVSRATASGAIVRPDVCPCCAKQPKPNALKKSQMFAVFKSGFENWRSLDWLCISCFRKRQAQ